MLCLGYTYPHLRNTGVECIQLQFLPVCSGWRSASGPSGRRCGAAWAGSAAAAPLHIWSGPAPGWRCGPPPPDQGPPHPHHPPPAHREHNIHMVREGYLSPLNRYDTIIDTWESIRYLFLYRFRYFIFSYYYFNMYFSIDYFTHHNR